MLAFLQQNLASLLVGAVVVGIIVVAVIQTRKNAKSGGCGCGCDGCGTPCDTQKPK